MAEDNTTADQSGTSIAVRPPTPRREVRVVESAAGIMDTARFEHLGRVATVMATAGLMPDSLTGWYEGTGNNKVFHPHPFEVVQARAFLIANQADLWKAEPNAVAQCTSIVHGKLMYEGKLVHAIIESRLGIRLQYEFGVYNIRKRDIDPLPEEGLGPDDQLLGVRVSGKFEDEEITRTISGAVTHWHKGAQSPWQSPAAWPRQLRYMGAREWARAHSPSILLGILTDDEIENYEIIQDQRAERAARRAPKPKANLQAQLAGPAQGEGGGFDENHIAAETAQGGGPDTQAAAETTQDAQETVQGGHDTLTGEVHATDAGAGQDSLPANEGADTVAGDGDEDAEQAALSEAEEEGDWPCSGAFEGPAPMGVVYQLSTDDIGSDSKVQVYKDGKPHQRYGALVCKEVPQYDAHPVTETHEEAEDATRAATAEEIAAAGGMSDEPEAEEGGLMTKIATLTEWPAIKAEVIELNKSPDFQELDPDDQAAVRSNIWAHVDRLIKAGTIKLDFITDVTAFRLWMDTQEGKEGADAIEGNFRLLKREPIFGNLPHESQEKLTNLVLTRVQKLRGKG